MNTVSVSLKTKYSIYVCKVLKSNDGDVVIRYDNESVTTAIMKVLL